jgi:hypothetical protein
VSAVACVVTDEEHVHLTVLGEAQQGWGRYNAPGIDVFDELEGGPSIEQGSSSPSQNDRLTPSSEGVLAPRAGSAAAAFGSDLSP